MLDKYTKKGFICNYTDTGLLQAIGKVNDGQLFENAIVNQLSMYGELSFYNKRNTSKIDIIRAYAVSKRRYLVYF